MKIIGTKEVPYWNAVFIRKCDKCGFEKADIDITLDSKRQIKFAECPNCG